MSMDQQETFNWMCTELARLRAELAEANQKIIDLTMDNARLCVKPIVDAERKAEYLG